MNIGLIFSIVALLGVVFACVVVIATKLNINRGASIDDGLVWGISWYVLNPIYYFAIGAGIVAVVFGCIATVRAERGGCKPHWTAQVCGVLGTLTTGGGGGIFLALYVLTHKITPGVVKHTTEMNSWAYVIMGVMLAIIIGGLGWCFYRAIKAAGLSQKEEKQRSEI